MSTDMPRPPQSAGNAALETAADRAALAAILEARGRGREARNTLQQALPLLEDVLGPEHLEVGMTLNSLAGMFLAAGHDREAAALYRRALPIFERTLGADHAKTLACRTNLDKATIGSRQ
jgi:tetratricopeptide (TPR) repeat protein